ncbi:hypothetical protein L7F22_006486 [Adiantum nelumboides]|nr:hypothetical protein [Adiantum nelumboides]
MSSLKHRIAGSTAPHRHLTYNKLIAALISCAVVSSCCTFMSSSLLASAQRLPKGAVNFTPVPRHFDTTSDVDVRASDWNNRVRDAAIKIASKIPEVGTVVSFLMNFFWPEDKIDIFQSLKADMTKLIKKEILEYELNRHQGELDGLRDIIQRYQAAETHEKGNLLDIWITDADMLSAIFRVSNNNISLIAPTITLALLHLSGLRERLDFGKDLYAEDNTKQWKQDLEDMYKTYIVDFLPTIFQQWKVWREDQIQINQWLSEHVTTIPPFFLYVTHATVVDAVTGETIEFIQDDLNARTYFQSVCEDHKTRMKNDAFAEMAGAISTTFEFRDLLPENDRINFFKFDKTVFGRVFKGPYAYHLCFTDSSFNHMDTRPNQDDYSQDSGPMSKIIIREWNSIDAMQFIYADRQGQLAGNPKGGMSHEIDVATKPVNGLRMGFTDAILAYIQINYYDGTTSETYGNRGGWQCKEATAMGPSAYKVNSWSYRVNLGPSGTYGPGVIQLEYTTQMDDY